MKSILFCFVSAIFFVACSTSPNNNGGSTTTVIPIAPSNLNGSALSVSSASLTWSDNSTNESGFKIERRLDGTLQFNLIGTVNADITGFLDTTLSPNTTYQYRVYSFNSVGNSLTYSNVISITTPQIDLSLPILSTSSVISVTDTTAICGGVITSEGGSNVTSRGVVWSTSDSPTITLNTKTIDGSGIGNFNSNITGLNRNTTYHLRAYATNANGTSYGNQQNFTTTNTINLTGVTICNQIWTSENISLSNYRNGDLIPEVTDRNLWNSLTTGAWCWYNNDSSNYWQYGKLYNWYAVVDPRGIAPTGWHMPTDAEWNKLAKCLDPNADTLCFGCSQSSIAGGFLKSTIGWTSPNTGATNITGFTALPGGQLTTNFFGVGSEGYWWTSTTSTQFASEAFNRSLNYANSNLGKDSPHAKANGLSVRLVKD